MGKTQHVSKPLLLGNIHCKTFYYKYFICDLELSAEVFDYSQRSI